MTALPRRTALAAALSLALGAGAPLVSAATLVTAAQPTVAAIDAARSSPNLIILRAGIIDPTQQRLDAHSVGAAVTPTTSAYAIVQFHANDRAARAALRSKGVEFLGYVPNNAYYVRLNGVRLEDLAKESVIRWAGQVEPAMKLDPTLWQSRRATSGARQDDGSYRLMVRGFDGVSSTTLEGELRKSVPNFEVTLRSERIDAAPYIVAKVDAASLDALVEKATAIDGVAFVAPWYPTHTMNSASIGAIQGKLTANCAGSGTICGATPMFDHKLTGSGQIIAVADSGTTVDSAYFTTLDKGGGPHTEITLAQNPPPVPPAIGTLHPDNKIIAYWTQPQGPTDYDFVSGHGSHTTGTVVGDAAGGPFTGNTFVASTPGAAHHEVADGMAPNAQLLMQDIGPNEATAVITADFEGTLLQAAAAGAGVHSDSWGSDTAGAYESSDEAADRATRQAENLLVVIAAGNDVPGAMAVGSPGNAKNAITVAALGHGGNLAKANFSNAGPTADGRKKPDVAAPGSATISSDNRTTLGATVQAPASISSSGTSMATPVVAGNAVLLRQYFVDGLYPRGMRAGDDVIFADGFDASAATFAAIDALNPTGALMKAVLLNGTIPTTTPSTFPNTGTGWGRPWLDSNLWFKTTLAGGEDTRRLRVFERTNAAGLETGDVNEYTIANIAAGAEFRATLAWYDVAASAGAVSTLVNNLDLEVVAPGGTLYRGNVFASNVSTTGGTADIKDTVEQVRFTAPAAGSYTIRVKAANTPGDGRADSDRQGYGLAVSGAFGLPDVDAFPAPSAVSLVSNDINGVKIGANAAGGAQSFQLYRADSTCAVARPGDFHLVAHGTSLPLADDRTNGGYAYAYKLRGVQNDVEGNVSACLDVLSNDTCQLTPVFDVESVTADSSNATCSVKLDWTAAQSRCPAAPNVTYDIELSDNPYFAFSPIQIASNLTSTTFTIFGFPNGMPLYSRVYAFDGAGNQAPVSLIKNATPSGIDGPDPGSFSDDVDNRSYLVMKAPWRITNTTASNGTFSYHLGADGQPYPDLVCASITTPAMQLTAGAVLNFQAKYDLEFEWDGVVQEISTDGGSNWTDLPPTGGYPSSFAQTAPDGAPVNACGYAASHGAFSGVTKMGSNADPNNGTAAVFKPFSTSLASYVGQNVMIRWRFSSDPASTFAGFFLDQVQINGAAGAGSYLCTP